MTGHLGHIVPFMPPEPAYIRIIPSHVSSPSLSPASLPPFDCQRGCKMAWGTGSNAAGLGGVGWGRGRGRGALQTQGSRRGKGESGIRPHYSYHTADSNSMISVSLATTSLDL